QRKARLLCSSQKLPLAPASNARQSPLALAAFHSSRIPPVKISLGLHSPRRMVRPVFPFVSSEMSADGHVPLPRRLCVDKPAQSRIPPTHDTAQAPALSETLQSPHRISATERSGSR